MRLLWRNFAFVKFRKTAVGSAIVIQQASSPRIGTPLFGLDEMSDVSAIARDIAFVLLCIVATVTLLVILISVRKVVRRLQEAMERVDDLLDSVVAARDAFTEFRDRVRSRTGKSSSDSDSGFNVVSWLLSPLSHTINRQFRRRARGDSDESR